jgi:hypothetical protein
MYITKVRYESELNWNVSGRVLLAGFCKHGNEPWGFIKGGC